MGRARWHLELIRARVGEVPISGWRHARPRVVSLFLPVWSTDRIRRKSGDASLPRDVSLILVGHDGQRRVMLAADAAAQAAGLRVGMPATKARTLIRDLIIDHADPEGDAAALERLSL